MIKNIVTISLLIFTLTVVSLLGLAVLNDPTHITDISLAEVAKHNTENDCWLVISGKVYNVTNYIPIHPAGPEKVIPYCGKDATSAFNSVDKHSEDAQNILINYYVGIFGG